MVLIVCTVQIYRAVPKHQLRYYFESLILQRLKLLFHYLLK